MQFSPLKDASDNSPLHGLDDHHLTDNIFLRLWKPAAKSYRYTFNELEKMGEYDSVEYGEPTNFVRRENLLTGKQTGRNLRWVIFGVIGFVVGIWGFLLFTSIGTLMDWKYSFFEDKVLNKGQTNHIWSNLAINLALILVSGCICALVPAASGSGVPEVMGYLNGVMFPRVFNIRTLLAKTTSTILSVSSGLPVGAEGPMIHIGSLIAAGVSSGRSRTLGCSIRALDYFRNPTETRDFVTAGAACGLTVVFCAPIGGLLFVMEEVASRFPVSLAWMVFFCCLCSFLISSVLNTFIISWIKLRPRFGAIGDLSADATTLFSVSMTDTVNIFNIILALVVGLGGGLLAVIFSAINLNVMRIRRRFITPHCIPRIAEPCLYTVIFTYLVYIVLVQWPCSKIPLGDVQKGYKLVQGQCSQGFHNAFASLSLTSVYYMVRSLFNAPDDTFAIGEILTYLFLYFSFASLAAGTSISHGLLIPTVVIGALYGRALGIGFRALVLCINPELIWLTSGSVSVLGCASFFAGMSRLTFSLVVIMMEMTHNLSNVLTLMFTIWSAKAIAESLTPSYYESVLRTKSVPFLHTEHHEPDMIIHSVRNIMSKPVICLPCIAPVCMIVSTLKNSTHRGFPIVNNKGQYCGLISRSQLEQLLWYIAREIEHVGAGATLKPASFEDLRKVREFMFWNRQNSIPENIHESLNEYSINLGPYVDTSAIAIPSVMSLERAYSVFLSLNLCHLVVTDFANEPVGMITRKDLVAYNVEQRLIKTKHTNHLLQEEGDTQLNQFLNRSDNFQQDNSPTPSARAVQASSLTSEDENCASSLLYPSLIVRANGS